jgi:hypothetical protein
VCSLSNSNSGWVNVQHDDDAADEPAAKRSKKNFTEEDEALTEVNNGVVRDTLSKEDRLKRAQALTASKVRPLCLLYCSVLPVVSLSLRFAGARQDLTHFSPALGVDSRGL